MKRIPIYCEICCRKITDKGDLIIVDEKNSPCHFECYKEILNKYKKRNIIYKLGHSMTPINGIYGNVRLTLDLIYMGILCILAVMIKKLLFIPILALLGFILIVKRLLIWLQYERHMKKDKSGKPKVKLSKIIISELADMIKWYIYILGISGISYLLVRIMYK